MGSGESNAEELGLLQESLVHIPAPLERFSDIDSWWDHGTGIGQSRSAEASLEDQISKPKRLSSRGALNQIEVQPGASGENVIQQAIDQIANGGRIILKEGEYKERIVISKPLTLVGEGTVSITAPGGDSTGALIQIQSSDVALENLSVLNARGTGFRGTGILVSGTDIARLKFDNVDANQNEGDGIAFFVSGKYDSIDFQGTNVRANEGYGIAFYGGPEVSGRNHELTQVLFEGNRNDRGVVAFNEKAGVSIRLQFGTLTQTQVVGDFVFRNAVLESNYGISQFVAQGLTNPLTFEGCWFNGGPFRGYDASQSQQIMVPSSQYAIILIGALKEENYAPIPSVKFVNGAGGQKNQFDGVYWFGVFNWIGWSDLSGMQFGESGGSGVIPAVQIGAALQGEDISESTSLIKASGVQGGVNLSGIQLNANRQAKLDFLMGGQPFSEDPQNPTPSTIAVNAKELLFETASGEVKTIEDMTLEERFVQSSRMVTKYNPSIRSTTALGAIEMVEGGDVYIVPSPGNSIQSILNQAPDGAKVYVQQGEYPEDSSLTIGRGQSIYFQGGLNAGGTGEGGVNLPGLTPEAVTVDPTAKTIDFGTPDSLGLARVSGLVLLDANRSGTLESGDLPLEGVSVFLDQDRDGVLDEGEPVTVSGSDGSYTLEVVDLGQRVVALSIPQDYVVSAPGSGVYEELFEADAILEDRAFLVSGAGFISGSLWEDSNANGVRDTEEPLLEDIEIILGRLGPDGQSFESLRTVTDAAGNYQFSRLIPGGYAFRKPMPGSWTLTRSPGDSTLFIQVASEPLMNQDFGVFELARISGTIYEDLNKNGTLDDGDRLSSGSNVTLDMGRDGSLDAFRVTDVSGRFGFDGIPAQPLGTFSILPALSSGVEITESESLFEITRSGQIFDQVRIGFYRPAVISGQVVVRTGQDISAAEDVIITLVENQTGVVVDTSNTTSSGAYSLVSYAPGEFRVVVNSLPVNTRVLTIPGAVTLQSGTVVSDQVIELAFNRAPILNSQTFNTVVELSPAGTVVGTIAAEDPDGDEIGFEVVSGNHVDSVAFRAWGFRSQFEGLFDATSTRAFAFAPPYQPGKLLQGIRRVEGVQKVELYWLTAEGAVYRNVFEGQIPPASNTAVLGELVANLDLGYYNNPELLFNALERPQGVAPFALNPQTGQLTVAINDLDRTSQPEGGFKLRVRVVDSLNASAENTVVIDLFPANHAPLFDQPSWVRQVTEDSPIGSAIGDVIAAQDPDLQPLTYSILQQKDTLFRLKELDQLHQFHDPSQGSFSFNARGQNEKWLHGTRSRQWFYIRLNSNTKRAELYASPKDAASLFQLAPAGQPPLLEMSDEYYESPSLLVGIATLDSNPPAIDIDASTGQLLVADSSALSPQVNPFFDLTVQVADSGTPTGFARSNVRVNIVPALSFPKTQRFSTFRVAENSAAGTLVGKFVATDPDGSEDIASYEIRYDESGAGSEAFRIDPDTGEIFVAEAADLDFESQIFYELIIRVRDRSRRWSEGRVIVDLINVDEIAEINVGSGSVREGNAGNRLLEIPVTLSSGFSESIPLIYSIESVSAELGVDFEDANPVPGQALVIPGDKSARLRFNILGDTALEADETFQIQLALGPEAPELLTINQAIGTGTIIDDDRPQVLDNSQSSGFTALGSGWSPRAGTYAVNSQYLFTESEGATAQWVFTGLEPGWYRVSASAPVVRSVGFYSVWNGSQRLASEIRLETFPWLDGQGTDLADPSEGAIKYWNDLGAFEVQDGSLMVRLKSKVESQASLRRIKLADAIRIEPVDQSPVNIFVNDPAPALFSSEQTVTLELDEPASEKIELKYNFVDPNGALASSVIRSGTVVFEPGVTSAALTINTALSETPSLESERVYNVRLGPVTEGLATIVDHSAVGRVVPEVFQTPKLDLIGPALVSEAAGSIPLSARLDQSAASPIRVLWSVSELSDSGEIEAAVESGEITFQSGARQIDFEILAIDNNRAEIPNRRIAVTLTPSTDGQVRAGQLSRVIELEDDDGPTVLDAPDLVFGQTFYSEINLAPGVSDWSDYNDGFGGVSRMAQGNVSSAGATAVAQWRVFGLEPGAWYRVSTTWPENAAFSPRANFRVLKSDVESGELTAVGSQSFDQTSIPDDLFTDELGRILPQGTVAWEDIGYFQAEVEEWRIQLSNNAPGIVVADAVRIERVFVPVIEQLEDQVIGAGTVLEIPVVLNHSDPDLDLKDVSIASVLSSSELIVPNNLSGGNQSNTSANLSGIAGVSWSAVDRDQGLWKIRIQPRGLRAGSVEFTVRATDGTNSSVTKFSVDFVRTNYLFDFGLSPYQDASEPSFIPIAKNSLYRESTQYGWAENRGLRVALDASPDRNHVLKDALTGPAVVDFKMGGLPPNSQFIIDFIPWVDPETDAASLIETRVQAVGILPDILPQAEIVLNKQKVNTIVARSDSEGLMVFRFSPAQQDTTGSRFGIAAMQVRQTGSASSLAWTSVETRNFNLLGVRMMDADKSGSNQTSTVPPNPLASIQSRNAGVEVTPVPPAPWLDDSGPAFLATEEWLEAEGFGFESSLHYLSFTSDTKNNGVTPAAWTFPNLESGVYRLAMHWKDGMNRSDQVAVRVRHQDEIYGPFLLDQTTAPNDFDRHQVSWEWVTDEVFQIAFDSFSPGTERLDGSLIPETYNNFVIEILPQSNGVAIADAVLLESVDAGPVVAEIPLALETIEGNAIGSDLAVNVALSSTPFEFASVDYKLVAGAATDGLDVELVEGTLVFEPGQTQGQILIPVFGDTRIEENETFQIEWSNPQGLTLSQNSTAVLIVDDDGGKSIQPVNDAVSVLEARVEGATVWRDSNGNGRLDFFEASSLTDEDGIGLFAARAAQLSAPLVAAGGFDRVTGDSLIYPLKAPASATTIHSLTTLLEALLEEYTAVALEDHVSQLQALFAIDAAESILQQNARAAFQVGFSESAARLLMTQTLIESRVLGLGSLRLGQMAEVITDQEFGWQIVSGGIFQAMARLIEETPVGESSWNWTDSVWNQDFLNRILTELGWEFDPAEVAGLAEAFSAQADFLEVVLLNEGVLEEENQRAQALAQLAQFRAYLKRDWIRSLRELGMSAVTVEDWLAVHSGLGLDGAILSQSTLNPISGGFSAGQISLVVRDYSAYESELRIGIEVVRTGGSLGEVGGMIQPVSGEALLGEDVFDGSIPFSFANGEAGSKWVYVGIQDDVLNESDEIFHVSLVSVSGGASLDVPIRVTALILDDDSDNATSFVRLRPEFDFDNQTLTLAWPEFLNGFSELQSLDGLGVGAEWLPHSKEGSVALFGIRSLTVPIEGVGARFYRLSIQLPSLGIRSIRGVATIVCPPNADGMILEMMDPSNSDSGWVPVPLDQAVKDESNGALLVPVPAGSQGQVFRLRGELY